MRYNISAGCVLGPPESFAGKTSERDLDAPQHLEVLKFGNVIGRIPPDSKIYPVYIPMLRNIAIHGVV